MMADKQRSAVGDAAASPPTDDEVQAMQRLVQAHALTQPAVDQARSLDQRATYIAAVAALAASLSPAGAALLLDAGKMAEPSWVRIMFGAALVLSVTFFLAAAISSLRTHRTKVTDRSGIPPDESPVTPERRRDDGTTPSSAGVRPTADVMHKMAERVELSLLDHEQAVAGKQQGTDRALTILVFGLGFVVLLTCLAFVAALVPAP